MKKIESKSKMIEAFPLPTEGKKRKAFFMKGEVTELSDKDYKFLVEKKNSVFKLLLDEGTLTELATAKKEDEKSGAEIAIDKLMEKKKTKALTKKEVKKLEKLRSEFEKLKERQGE